MEVDSAVRSRVTTKKGDQGRTVTIAGDEYSKSHPILACCGDLDALRAETALCRLALLSSDAADSEELGDFLFWILHIYFLIGTQCNDPSNKKPQYRREEVSANHLEKLEAMQEKLEAGIDLPKDFIVSASNELAARFDVLCTTARRLERSVVELRETVPEFGAEAILRFVNRLSDFLYVLARHLDHGDHIAVDYSVLDEERDP